MQTAILAPHVDDEMIGCHSLLSKRMVTDVFYFFDLTPERMKEAQDAARKFGFQPHFVLEEEQRTLDLSKFFTIYVPSIQDAHPHHKLVNSWYRDKASAFYRVDLNGSKKINAALSKQQDLNDCYPSQRSLWDSDASYYLFESISETDYSEQVFVQLMLIDTPVRVLVDRSMVTMVPEIFNGTPRALIDYLVKSGLTSFEIYHKATVYKV